MEAPHLNFTSLVTRGPPLCQALHQGFKQQGVYRRQMYKEGSRFFRLVALYAAVYALTLYTWTKPLLEPDLSYLKDYSIEKAPIWSVEQATYINEKSCPPEDFNFDRNAVEANRDRWNLITDEHIWLWRDAMMKYLATARHEGHTGGRGIVMSAGDHVAMQRAGVAISLLRSSGCELPVQIYHYADEAAHISPNIIDVLKNLGAEVIELTGVSRGEDWKAYHIKAIAIQRCSFDEILYLDTDSYPARDPTYLFDSKPFKETGAMLWPDFTRSHPSNPVWRLLGIPCRPEYEGESGQLMFNRFMHQEAMHLAEFFALNRDPYYFFMGGDRDSFRVALLALGKKWAGPRRMVAAAGLSREQAQGHTMLQADHNGEWLFVHANLLKHAPIPRDETLTWSTIVRAKDDTFKGDTGYGTVVGNEDLGHGIKVDVSPIPDIFTHMTGIESGKTLDKLLLREDFKKASKFLADFEEKFFKYGGKRLS